MVLVHPGIVFTDMTQPKTAVLHGDLAEATQGLKQEFTDGAVAFGGPIAVKDIVDCFLLPLQDKRINGSGNERYERAPLEASFTWANYRN